MQVYSFTYLAVSDVARIDATRSNILMVLFKIIKIFQSKLQTHLPTRLPMIAMLARIHERSASEMYATFTLCVYMLDSFP